ncbi:MAG: glutathione-regulated potassium-efflux system protein kefB [Candidatus Xenolissoclinum pacificiensis L6]|uniref:Glutathione-regulated potassium-efflux system protein kefB n=1 Tax=Candidatus Xenolissoclinum pacificiensis L6 TaxID=1401685 RepID=W2V1I2_9RICK|nr:MAG: glutathione-regulated potassium-efflux system protein kefB [Candidatus Xenolissoclinum pacificiensis L6]
MTDTITYIGSNPSSLSEVLILLFTAVATVTIFFKIKVSPILGYFVAGALLGINGFGFIHSVVIIEAIAEFGVVFLLFMIGLELTVDRLMTMRSHVFGFGSLQFFITSIVIIALCHYLSDIGLKSSVIIGASLSLSSTALVLQVVQEHALQNKQVGRLSIAILLLQDFAVVPLLVLIPLIESNSPQNILFPIGQALVKATIVLIIIFMTGRLVLRPTFKFIATTKSNELFVATTLLVILGSAYLTEKLELSLAMGAFVAGLLVAETEYDQEVEHVVLPFKSLLLGLFFMTIGMSIDIVFLIDKIWLILSLTTALIVVKSVIIMVLGYIFGFRNGSAIHGGLLLAQGSEFALILINLATKKGITSEYSQSLITAIITTSMGITPVLSYLGMIVVKKMESRNNPPLNRQNSIELETMDVDNHVVIIGFGKAGKMVAKMLTVGKINYIAIDKDEEIVKKYQEKGFSLYYGDVRKLSILKAIGAGRAKLVVIAFENKHSVKQIIQIMKNNFPDVTIILRVKDLKENKELKGTGVILIPENFEIGLQLGGAVLVSNGISEYNVSLIKNRFRSCNYAMIKEEDTED